MAPSSNKLRAQFPPGVDGARREVLRRSTTYLARIAIILQDAPDKMLTFMQLMDRMGPLVRHDRKSIENNIRVCLSTNKCFVKIPLVPDSLGSKRNFWKLELSLITTKMVRRHFKDIMDFFPELSSRREDGGGTFPPPPPSVQISCEVKFNGPFSIESLLKRDSPAPTRTSTHEACVSIHSEHDHLDYTTPHAQKRCLDWDAEHLIPGHYRSSVICPQEGSTFNTTSKRLCIGPPFPIYSVTSFNETYFQYPNYDPRHFCL